jgi:hypothetical protein
MAYCYAKKGVNLMPVAKREDHLKDIDDDGRVQHRYDPFASITKFKKARVQRKTWCYLDCTFVVQKAKFPIQFMLLRLAISQHIFKQFPLILKSLFFKAFY